MRDTTVRCVVPQLDLRAERRSQEFDEVRGAAGCGVPHVHVGSHGVGTFREVGRPPVCRDVPMIPSRVFDESGTLAVWAVRGRAQRFGSRVESAPKYRVCIFHVDVQADKTKREATIVGSAGRAAAEHQHRVANAQLTVRAARAADRPICLLGVEYVFGESNDRFDIGRHQIGRHRHESGPDSARAHRRYSRHGDAPFQSLPQTHPESGGWTPVEHRRDSRQSPVVELVSHGCSPGASAGSPAPVAGAA